MSIIKIYANDILLNIKKDTLTLKKENNSLSMDFKVVHSSFPFLIVDDEACKTALGSSDITSTTKKKIIPVTVLELGVKYYGELQQMSVIKGYRKCNLKYSSEVLTIINKKISEFMPSVSVIPGETNPIPYTEKTIGTLTGVENWQTFPVSMIGKIYPEVKFQFPTMYWKNKFGVDLEPTDRWYNYKNLINRFGTNDLDETVFIENTVEIVGLDITTTHLNVVSPQVFLPSPLYYIFKHLGWKVSGNFIDHELIREALFLSTKDNFTKTILNPPGELIDLNDDTWKYFPGLGLSIPYYEKIIIKPITISGKYKLIYSFQMPNITAWRNVYDSFSLLVIPSGGSGPTMAFRKPYPANITPIVSGEIEFNCDLGNVYFRFNDTYANDPISYSMELILVEADTVKEYDQMHTTINLGRFVPDWTVGNYLNYLKNQFNLDITLDDFKKEITLNLNETIDEINVPEVTIRSLLNDSYELVANSSFILKYANDEDVALYISKEQTIVNYDGLSDDFTKYIDSKFKLVPRNGYTSELSEAVESKDGVGLMIYEPINAPFTSEATINGFNLNIPGEKGIHETFFRRWLKFRLNASRVELRGFFTEMEISKIYKSKSIYIDNQRYMIDAIEYSEQTNNYYDLKLVLESVNY